MNVKMDLVPLAVGIGAVLVCLERLPIKNELTANAARDDNMTLT